MINDSNYIISRCSELEDFYWGVKYNAEYSLISIKWIRWLDGNFYSDGWTIASKEIDTHIFKVLKECRKQHEAFYDKVVHAKKYGHYRFVGSNTIIGDERGDIPQNGFAGYIKQNNPDYVFFKSDHEEDVIDYAKSFVAQEPPDESKRELSTIEFMAQSEPSDDIKMITAKLREIEAQVEHLKNQRKEAA
jgi:hypothetical protein